MEDRVLLAADLDPALADAPATGTVGAAIMVSTDVDNLWSDPSGGYTIQYRLSTDSVINTSDILLKSVSRPSIAGNGDQRWIESVTIPSSVAPGTYRVGVIVDPSNLIAEGNESNNTQADSDTIALTIAAPLPAPTLLSPANGATGVSTTPTFSWSPVSGATSYRILVATTSAALPSGSANPTSSPSLLVNEVVTDTSYALGGGVLAAGTTYYWEVRAGNSTTGAGGFWSAQRSLTTASIIVAPTNVSASDGTYTDRVLITWTGSTGASHYEVWRNTSNSTTGATQLASTLTTTSYSDTTALAGTTYYYFVKAKNTEGTSPASFINSGYRAVEPANNNFASRVQLSGDAVTAAGTNAHATKETGEPNHAGNAGGKSVWWKWTAPASGSVQIDTIGSNFYTLLGVYTGSSVSALTTVASNDNSDGNLASKATFWAVSGTVYQIAVDGYNGASGNIGLHVTTSQINGVVLGTPDTKPLINRGIYLTQPSTTGCGV